MSAYAVKVQEYLKYARKLLRTNEVWLILVAVAVGMTAGATATVIATIARAMHVFFFDIAADVPLSSLSVINTDHLIYLPLGGALIGLVIIALRHRPRGAIDVVEANALHGGRIPLFDTMLVVFQTVMSNGVGASVGLEAAYAQAGGGFASVLGQWLNLRRSDMRTLVGAGAGGAIAAAFGAPLAGAFYAFEIVIGAYTPASIPAVAAASVTAVITAQVLGVPPYLLVASVDQSGTLSDYMLYAGLGIVCAVLGIWLMRLVSAVEAGLRAISLPEAFRPVVGGLFLIPLAMASPHSLSSGHGALHLTIAVHMALSTLFVMFCLKAAASIVSLGFGFRGGLFFASLFLGALVGQMLSAALVMLPGVHPLPLVNAALVGMAAMAVAVVGGPMTMSLLVLEQTHDFGITVIVLTAALCSSAFARTQFGYSFSTWRLHLRGEAIRSARDIGWTRTLTASQLMHKAPATAVPDMSLAAFRQAYPLGSTSRVILTDADGRYCGIMPTASAYVEQDEKIDTIADLAILKTETLAPDMDISIIIGRFEDYGADDLAVVDAYGMVLGMVTENYARKRFADELDQAQRELFGEGVRRREEKSRGAVALSLGRRS